MSVGKILLLIFGVLIVIIGLGFTVAGGGALWANSALTDDDRYLTTKTIRIEQGSYAIVTEPTDISVGSVWVWDWGDLATFKIEGSNDDSSKNIFMGIADESDLSNYLRDVNYDEVSELEISPDRLDYRNHPGSSAPEGSPADQQFWLESVNGAGTQTLEWELQSGTWSLVLMNEDGSAGIDLSVILGVKIPWLFGTGVGLLVGGILALMLGTFMIVMSVRKPRTV